QNHGRVRKTEAGKNPMESVPALPTSAPRFFHDADRRRPGATTRISTIVSAMGYGRALKDRAHGDETSRRSALTEGGAAGPPSALHRRCPHGRTFHRTQHGRHCRRALFLAIREGTARLAPHETRDVLAPS